MRKLIGLLVAVAVGMMLAGASIQAQSPKVADNQTKKVSDAKTRENIPDHPPKKQVLERPDTLIILFAEGAVGAQSARAADSVARNAGLDSQPLNPVTDAGARMVGERYLKKRMLLNEEFKAGWVILIYTKKDAAGYNQKVGEEFIPPPPNAAQLEANKKGK